jgi:FixJ family two-component response regulator
MKTQSVNKAYDYSTCLQDSRRGRPFPLVGIVDDDRSAREAIGGILRSADYRTALFESAEAFLSWSDKHEMGCLVLDAQMSGLGGLGLQRRLGEMNISIPVVFVMAVHDDDIRARALSQGAVAVLTKPFSGESLINTIQPVLISPACKVRNALLDSYNAANLLYTQCLSELHQKRGTCSKRVYDDLEHEVEDLRRGVYRAFIDLEQHLSEHRCESATLCHAAGR